MRFNSSTGSRTTLCGPPRILAGSIRFIGYDRQRPFGPIGIGISAAETDQETMTEMLHVGGLALPHLLAVTRNGSAAALSALNIWQIPSLQALPSSAAFYVSAHGSQASQVSATRSLYRIRFMHPLRHISHFPPLPAFAMPGRPIFGSKTKRAGQPSLRQLIGSWLQGSWLYVLILNLCLQALHLKGRFFITVSG